jgi:hypothetical protein
VPGTLTLHIRRQERRRTFYGLTNSPTPLVDVLDSIGLTLILLPPAEGSMRRRAKAIGEATEPRRRKTKKAHRRNARTGARGPSAAELQGQLDRRDRELQEALEQQAATSEVLRVISTSPGELQPVFDAMLANATRICDAKFGMLYLWEKEGQYRVAALHGAPPRLAKERRRGVVIRPAPTSGLGRCAIRRGENAA